MLNFETLDDLDAMLGGNLTERVRETLQMIDANLQDENASGKKSQLTLTITFERATARGETYLIVSGNVKAKLMPKAAGATAITIETPWIEGQTEMEGVR